MNAYRWFFIQMLLQAAALMMWKLKGWALIYWHYLVAKVYGPKQVGLLWVRPGVTLKANIFGGGQELGLRSGTETLLAWLSATALE